MKIENDEIDGQEMVQCKLCPSRVWLRKDRLDKHIQKVHPSNAAPKKSFTTYTANIASTYPPKVVQPTSKNKPPKSQNQADIKLLSRTGSRAGQGRCGECGLESQIVWRFTESNQGPINLCGGCKAIVFERSFSDSRAGSSIHVDNIDYAK